jgi:hypothetical protein
VTNKAKDERPAEELTEQELEEADGEALPDRHALSVIRGFETLPQPVVPEPPLDWE